MISIREQIESRLRSLNPARLEVIDDSCAHAGHAGAAQHAARNSPNGLDNTDSAESHFELMIVSAAFTGKPLVARHRMIYTLLDDLMKTQIHALKIDARSL